MSNTNCPNINKFFFFGFGFNLTKNTLKKQCKFAIKIFFHLVFITV